MRRDKVYVCVRLCLCEREIYIYRDLNSEVSEAEKAPQRIFQKETLPE